MLVTGGDGRADGARQRHRRPRRRDRWQLRAVRSPARTSSTAASRSSARQNMPSAMATHASFLYSRNIAEFLGLLVVDGRTRAGLRRRDHRRDLRHPRRRDPPQADRSSSSEEAPDERHRHPRSAHGLRPRGVRRLEVISKVPSILHTPLMSGTNAIHGVILVGAMLILGTAHGAIQIVARVRRRRARDGERRRRLRRHRPDARDVQGAPARQGRPDADESRAVVSIGTGIRLADLVAAICFILALKGLSNPKGARVGNLIGAAGMALAIGFTFATPGLSRFGLIVGGDGDRRRHRRPRGAAREDDRDAADGGGVQRRRRRRGRARRAVDVPASPRRRASRSTRSSRPCSASSSAACRSRARDRLLEAAGADDRPADHLPRPAGDQRPRSASASSVSWWRSASLRTPRSST